MSESQAASVSEEPSVGSARRPSMPLSILRLLRPAQWSKNGLLFLAFVFSLNLHWDLDDPGTALGLFLRAAAGAAIYVALSGATYAINDIIDADRDRAHPTKRERPIAAGHVTPTIGFVASAVLLTAGLGAAFLMSWLMGLIAAGYVILTLGYSALLKNIVVIDVVAVAAAYLVRVTAGAVAIDVPISPWLYVCTTLGALLIAIGKRHSEVALMDSEASSHRSTLDHYSRRLLNQMIAVVAPAALLAYALYTITASNLPFQMVFTLPFMIYGVYRYVQLIRQGQITGEPERVLLQDKPMMVAVLAWMAAVVAILIIFPRPV